MNKDEYNEVSQRISRLESVLNGGKGSGNFGHYGRPGEIGGSAATPTPMYDVEPDGERLKARDKRFGLIYQGITKQRSINLDRENNPIEWGKSDGFLVRGYGKRASISVKDFEDENDRFAFIQGFEASNLGHLLGDNDVLSGWVKDGQVVLDASKRFKTAKEAAKEAALRGQKAVVDIKRVKALDTKDLMKKYKIESEVITQIRKKEAEEKERKRKQGEIDIKVRYTQGMTMKAKTYNELMSRIQKLEKLLNQERPDPESIIKTDQDKKYGIDVLAERIVSDKARIEELKAQIDKTVSLSADGQGVDTSELESELKAVEDDLREAQEELRIADTKKKEEQALVQNGGKGSGNFGHKGRPGQIGGSGDGSGIRVHEISHESDLGYYAEDGRRVLASGKTEEEAREKAKDKSFHSRYEKKKTFEYMGQTFIVDKDGRGGHSKKPGISTMFPDEILFAREEMIKDWEKRGTKKLDHSDYHHIMTLYKRLAFDDIKHFSPYSDSRDKAKNHELKVRLGKIAEKWEREHPGAEFTNSLRYRRLNEMKKALNGGKGSGNYGHYGRPGQVGGSASSPSASAKSQEEDFDNVEWRFSGDAVRPVSAMYRIGERNEDGTYTLFADMPGDMIEKWKFATRAEAEECISGQEWGQLAQTSGKAVLSEYKPGKHLATEYTLSVEDTGEELRKGIDLNLGQIKAFQKGYNAQIEARKAFAREQTKIKRLAKGVAEELEKMRGENAFEKNGGKGSGNFGHYGRPGLVGGSASADGAVQAIGKGITDKMRETGGFTVSTQGDFKELGSAKGFGVGGFGTERSITVDEWNNSNKRRAFIRKYLEENRATFESDPERNHFGGWEEEGRVYLDVTRIFKSQKQAATEAAKTHQDAITDFSKTYESGKAFPRTKDLVKKYGLQDIWKKSANVRKEERKADQESQKKTVKKKKDPLEDIPF